MSDGTVGEPGWRQWGSRPAAPVRCRLGRWRWRRRRRRRCLVVVVAAVGSSTGTCTTLRSSCEHTRTRLQTRPSDNTTTIRSIRLDHAPLDTDGRPQRTPSHVCAMCGDQHLIGTRWTGQDRKDTLSRRNTSDFLTVKAKMNNAHLMQRVFAPNSISTV